MQLTFEAKTLAQLHDFRALVREGLLIQVGNMFIPWDIAQSVEARATLIAGQSNSGDIAELDTALWIHTGTWTPTLIDGCQFTRSSTAPFSKEKTRRVFAEGDVVSFQELACTSLERTAYDLLRRDYVSGVGYTLALIRHRANYATIRRMLHRNISTANTKRAREVIDQIPDDVIARAQEIAQLAPTCIAMDTR